jgi:hypothetical protein
MAYLTKEQRDAEREIRQRWRLRDAEREDRLAKERAIAARMAELREQDERFEMEREARRQARSNKGKKLNLTDEGREALRENMRAMRLRRALAHLHRTGRMMNLL